VRVEGCGLQLHKLMPNARFLYACDMNAFAKQPLLANEGAVNEFRFWKSLQINFRRLEIHDL
jgi:hypothetical protein